MEWLPLILVHDEETPDAAEVCVEGSVSGRPCRFLLDTGCARTALMHDGTTAPLAVTGRHASAGAFGRVEYDLVEIDELRAGPIARRGLRASRAAPGGLHRHLLGADVVVGFRLRFRFAARRLEFPDGPPPASFGADRELLLDAGGIPHVPVECDGAGAFAVWDSGAGITLVDLAFIRAHPAAFVAAGTSRGTDSTGESRETPVYAMSSFEAGGLRFPAHPVVGLDLGFAEAAGDIGAAMILGFSTLRFADWDLDFPARRWRVGPATAE